MEHTGDGADQRGDNQPQLRHGGHQPEEAHQAGQAGNDSESAGGRNQREHDYGEVKDVPAVAEIAVGPGSDGEYLQRRLDDKHHQYCLLGPAYPRGISFHHGRQGFKAKNDGVEEDEADNEVFEGVGFGEPVGIAPHLVKHGLESATSIRA